MILVDIYVPAVDDTYDFLLDECVEIEKILSEVVEMVGKKVKNNVKPNPMKFELYLIEREEALPHYETLCSCGVTDGDKLMLV